MPRAPEDFFEQLAELEIPPEPVDFDRSLHQRMNTSLLGLHLLDFAFRAMPAAMWHFAHAVSGAIVYTVRGGRSVHKRRGKETL